MANAKKLPKVLSILSLFNKNDKYIIPIYQRNYAWGESEIWQLLQDILDVANEKSEHKKNYYIGSLVVHKRKRDKEIFEIIDGQQRHTTLSIVLSVLKKSQIELPDNFPDELNLGFDSRPQSVETLERLFKGEEHGTQEEEPNIRSAYEIIKNFFDKLKDSDINTLASFLFKNVKILRVIVPEDTDLNHYFEIMNNRGEQLEKHEVLKARFMSELTSSEDRKLFADVWDACSEMDGYVLKHSLPVSDAKELQDKFDGVFNELDNENAKNREVEPATIANIISEDYLLKPSSNNKEYVEKNYNYRSIINFPNFLLHVLKIHTNENVSLDDKRLIEQFTAHKEKLLDPKSFIVTLLECRLLFDRYIIKRNDIGEKWDLKTIKDKDYENTFSRVKENDKLIMLLSMFHVSFPAQTNKKWLNDALFYLYEKSNKGEAIEANCYTEKLEEVARFNFDERFINNSDSLHQGTSVQNYFFNYLDYLIWKKIAESEKNELSDLSEKGCWKNFKFTFRSSVEHYYPQNPMNKSDELKEKILNNFGNLCLISSSQNSKLSNFTPRAKKEHYQKSETVESLKQTVMMSYEEWGKDEINEHGEKMIELFEKEKEMLELKVPLIKALDAPANKDVINNTKKLEIAK